LWGFAEPERPHDIAAKIRLYLDNPELLKIQGKNGYLYAKTHFDREKLPKKYLKYLT
jgi:glycosyltransferase involved in cell wall biosynthesis